MLTIRNPRVALSGRDSDVEFNIDVPFDNYYIDAWTADGSTLLVSTPVDAESDSPAVMLLYDVDTHNTLMLASYWMIRGLSFSPDERFVLFAYQVEREDSDDSNPGFSNIEYAFYERDTESIIRLPTERNLGLGVWQPSVNGSFVCVF